MAYLAVMYLTYRSRRSFELGVFFPWWFEFVCWFVEWFLYSMYAVDSRTLKPKCCHKYVGNIFTVLLCGPSAHKNFLD